MSVIVERRFRLHRQGGPTGGTRQCLSSRVDDGRKAPSPVEGGKTPRIAILMALAIRCNELIRRGAVPNATEMARLAYVTQPRMTQILNLTLLAPDIQEALLGLATAAALCERLLRPMTRMPLWENQRRAWQLLLADNALHEDETQVPTTPLNAACAGSL